MSLLDPIYYEGKHDCIRSSRHQEVTYNQVYYSCFKQVNSKICSKNIRLYLISSLLQIRIILLKTLFSYYLLILKLSVITVSDTITILKILYFP